LNHSNWWTSNKAGQGWSGFGAHRIELVPKPSVKGYLFPEVRAALTKKGTLVAITDGTATPALGLRRGARQTSRKGRQTVGFPGPVPSDGFSWENKDPPVRPAFLSDNGPPSYLGSDWNWRKKACRGSGSETHPATKPLPTPQDQTGQRGRTVHQKPISLDLRMWPMMIAYQKTIDERATAEHTPLSEIHYKRSRVCHMAFFGRPTLLLKQMAFSKSGAC